MRVTIPDAEKQALFDLRLKRLDAGFNSTEETVTARLESQQTGFIFPGSSAIFHEPEEP